VSKPRGLEGVLLEAIHAAPNDLTARLALADALEEQGDMRSELLRLALALTQAPGPPDRPAREERLRELLLGGTRPCVPALTNSVGMTLVLVPPGTFLMGSPSEERARFASEGPQHAVTLTRAFYVGAHAVTRTQWLLVMGQFPRGDDGEGRANFPVVNVTWERCQAFCARLSEREGHTYRLPTEAEWEYVCRAGTTTPYWSGDEASLRKVGWCSFRGGCAGRRPRPVGSYLPNAFGLYDTHGNVLEWTQGPSYRYEAGPLLDPRPTTEGNQRVLRGGGWHNEPRYCRSACRLTLAAGRGNDCVGFRVVREAAG
jgi:uncharacterized protein (TIGR02996 family)